MSYTCVMYSAFYLHTYRLKNVFRIEVVCLIICCARSTFFKYRTFYVPTFSNINSSRRSFLLCYCWGNNGVDAPEEKLSGTYITVFFYKIVH